MLKFQCTVEILNRLAVSVGQNGRIRAVKGVVSFKKFADGNSFICISTGKNLAAHQFSVKAITSVRRTFLTEGKLTLEISEPPVNVMLRDANVRELEKFVDEIAKCKEARPVQSEVDIEQPKWGISPVSRARRPENKCPVPPPLKKIEASNIKKALKTTANCLRIQRKSDYPFNGFDHDLKEIAMNEIMLKKVDIRLLRLKNLSILNLSNNRLTSIETLMSMESQLKVLVLDGNRIKSISDDFFDAKSVEDLEQLSLNDNELEILPRSVVKLTGLRHFSVSRNQLTSLPYNIHFLKSLTSLTVDGNKLTFLPHPLMSMCLNTLDISSNLLFKTQGALQRSFTRSTFPTLFELASDTVATHNYKNHRQPAKRLKVVPDELPRIACEMVESCKLCTKCAKMTCRYSLRNQRTRSCADSVISDGVISRSQLPTKAAICENCSS